MREEQVIGSISACIAGDHRYTTVIRVKYLPKTGMVEVTREENGACGGMDGNGMSDPFHVLQRVSIARPDGKSIVKAVKMEIKWNLELIVARLLSHLEGAQERAVAGVK